jgi:hypothetical protein
MELNQYLNLTRNLFYHLNYFGFYYCALRSRTAPPFFFSTFHYSLSSMVGHGACEAGICSIFNRLRCTVTAVDITTNNLKLFVLVLRSCSALTEGAAYKGYASIKPAEGQRRNKITIFLRRASFILPSLPLPHRLCHSINL